MKYIAFWEFAPEDMDKMLEKYTQMLVEREKGTDRFPKIFLEPYSIVGECRGFTIFETDDLEQLTNWAYHYMPEAKIKFEPILESEKTVELYPKMK